MYKFDTSISTTNFSTPHFITLLIEHNYLKNDVGFSIGREPVLVTEKNLQILAKTLKGEIRHRLPIVIVTKTAKGENPVDTGLLASKLKGVAHVLVLKDKRLGRKLSSLSGQKNLKNGNIGIYFGENKVKPRLFPYRRGFDVDRKMLERVVHLVVRYSVAHNFKPLYTWQGVGNAILAKRIEIQKNERIQSEKLLIKDKDEAYKLMDAVDEDFKRLQNQLDELNRENERLTAENNGYKIKLSRSENEPVIFMGKEAEFFPGEIKNILMNALADTVKKTEPGSRRNHVLKDLYESNYFEDYLSERQRKVKQIFKGYDQVNKEMKQALNELGFTLTEDGKHYKLTYYGDNRYPATVAKTPSDNRSGSNIAAIICRQML